MDSKQFKMLLSLVFITSDSICYFDADIQETFLAHHHGPAVMPGAA